MQKLAAMMMFQQSCTDRYSGVKRDIYNRRLASDDNYPTDWNGVSTLLDNLKLDPKREADTG